MINYERVAEKIFSVIKGHGHILSMYKEDGMDTTDAAEARRFFVMKPNYMITLDDETNTIKINKNSDLDLEDLESIMKQMKNLARENMLNTQVRVFGKEITPKDFAYQAKKFKDKQMSGISEAETKSTYTVTFNNGKSRNVKAKNRDEAKRKAVASADGANPGGSILIIGVKSIKKLKEADITEASLSRMTGSKKTSYQTLESVKLIVRHRKAVDEEVRGSRSRQIKAIFLEQAGERFRFPHNHLAGARAMARHMYEGGNMQDTIGEYIIESVSNLIQLAEFIRYTRTNKLINETSEDVIKIVKENITTLRGELKGLTGAKSYANISETITTREIKVLEEDDTDLQNMFTVRKFDEKFGATLPLVSRLLSEKQAWRAALLEASKQTIFMKAKEDLAEEDIMEFENPVQQVGYKIGKVAKRMVESGDLSKFVAKVAGKLIEGEKISDFEHTIVRNVMENGKIEENTKCDSCGCYDCTCTTNKRDTVESIGDAFELKMKMIEHEEIFEEETTKCGVCSKQFVPVGNPDDDMCPSCTKDYLKEEEPKKTSCSKCNGTGREPGERDSRYNRKIFSAISCTACDGYGYGLSGDPARSLGKAKVTEGDYKDCPDCIGGYTQDGKDCKTCEGDGKVYEDFDDHHAGEIEAGAHSGMPEPDYAVCPHCEGTGKETAVGNPLVFDDDECTLCGGSGETDYVPGSRQDPFSGKYNVDAEDFMDDDYEDYMVGEEDFMEEAPIYKTNKEGDCTFCRGEGFDPRKDTYGDNCPKCSGEGNIRVRNTTMRRGGQYRRKPGPFGDQY